MFLDSDLEMVQIDIKIDVIGVKWKGKANDEFDHQTDSKVSVAGVNRAPKNALLEPKNSMRWHHACPIRQRWAAAHCTAPPTRGCPPAFSTQRPRTGPACRGPWPSLSLQGSPTT